MAEVPLPETSRPAWLPDAVLLIDGDNDPHLPPDFAITPNTLVRVFLRPGAKMPRPLERRLEGLPLCVTVGAPRGGANAADFIMSLHAGLLHATLPLHLPFTLVTHDKSLAIMAEELQRLGRQAALWTSHPERSVRAPRAESATRGVGRGRGRGRRSGSGSPAVPTPAPAPVPVPPTATIEPALTQETPAAPPAAAPAESLAAAAAVYARRLGRIKDPPSRLKTLLNDIAHRAAASGHPAEAILEELKRTHGVTVDEAGHVAIPAAAIAVAAPAPSPAPRPRHRRRRR